MFEPAGPQHPPIQKDPATGLRLSWRALGARIALPFVITRAALIIAGFLALNQLQNTHDRKVWEINPNGDVQVVHLTPPPVNLSSSHHPLVNMFSRWDAQWYLDIAKNGYRFVPTRGTHSSTAFFPLYPVLMAGVSRLMGPKDVSLLISGLLISNVSLLVALIYLGALVRLDFDEDTAARSILYLLVFPATFFFSAVYTESLFLASVLIAFYYARHGKWWLAGLAGAAAALTRPPGVLIFAALALEYLQQHHFRWREIRANVMGLAFIPLALLAHFIYLAFKFGNFWLFVKTEQDWGRPLVGTPQAERVSIGHFAGGDICIALLSLILITMAWRRLRPSYALFATLAFLMPLASGKLLGMGRFCAILFPIYIMLALAGKNSTFDRYWLIVSSSMAVLFMALFAQWRYVG